MERIIIPKRQLVAAVRAIAAVGKSPLSEKIYRENILPGYESKSRRNIAIANLVAELSPARSARDWYTVSLFMDTESYLLPEEAPEEFISSILEAAGISKRYAFALKEAAPEKNLKPGSSDLALALRYADMHVDELGRLMDDNDAAHGMLEKNTAEMCRDLVTVNCELKRRGKLERYRNILDTLYEKGGQGGREAEVIQQSVQT